MAKKLSQKETEKLIGGIREAYEAKIRQLNYRLDSLNVENRNLRASLAEYKNKENKVGKAIVDAEEKGENGQQGERKIQFLFKMDVESLGFVEMTLAAAKGRVDVDVYGPSGVTDHSSVIAEDLLEILKSHGLPGRNVRVLEEKRPLTLTEVFPDLFEGKRSINVKI